MKFITPWIVPNHKFKEFCNCRYFGDNYYIESILRHDDKNYCVITNGSYPFVATKLQEILNNDESEK
jgi:hypothetical protein